MKAKQIYLDHNATTVMLAEVTDALRDIINKHPYNASSLHAHGRRAKGYLEEARDAVKEFVKAGEGFNVVFTASGTEANNLALRGISDVITVPSAIEHPSVLNVGHHAWVIPVDQDGIILVEALEHYLQVHGGVKYLVSVMLANNEIGTVQPLKKVVSLVHQYGGLVHTDAVQAMGRIEFDIEALGVDMVTMAAHKLGGPLGAGALIYREDIDLQPIIVGGGQEYRLRSGTHNIMAIHGMGVACKTLSRYKTNMQYVETLRSYMEECIYKQCQEVVFFGQNAVRLPNTSSIGMPGVSANIQVMHFDLCGISVSAGSACSSGIVGVPYVQLSMGYPQNVAETALRVSIGLDNTQDEIDYFVSCWIELYKRTSIKRF